MSCSKWAYIPSRCDGEPCPGDCDNCVKADDNVALIDETLIDTIRNDTDIDSIQWLRNVIHGYEKLCQYGGYVGLTEDASDCNTQQLGG